MQTASAAKLAERPDRLPLGIKLGFGVGDLGGNLFFTVMGFYLVNYLTDSFGLAAAAAGTAVALGKVWDAVTDPAVGYLSDRTHTRFGRRRPYMAVGAVFLFIFMILMFTDPGIATETGRFVWALVIYCLLNTAYTLVNIPYGSLTPELTADFDERTTLNGFRMSFAVVGTLVGAGAVLPLVGLFGGGSSAWTITGAIMGALMAVTTFITVFTVKEQLGAPLKDRGRIIKSYMQVLGQKPFLTVLIPYALHMTGVAVIQASLIYYFRYIYEAEGQFVFALMCLLVTCLVLIPVWVSISRRIGKKAAYNIGMGIFAAAVIVFFFLGTSLPLWFAFVTFTVAGVGLSTNYVMPWSLVPDAVEYDFAQSGRRREGIFYGMWTFTSKLGQAFGLGLTGWLLGLFGYIEPGLVDVDPVQPGSAILGMRLLVGPVPAFFFVAGIIVLSFYPITRAAYDEIMRKAKAREAGEDVEPELESWRR
jgi:GPH family glycoside/pentoside/hexuronide:cation symporter